MPQVVRTHVFTDIRGYSRIVDEKGDTAAAKYIRTYSRIIRDALPARGVQVEQTGDTFHLAFASPGAALRAAFAIADALRRHNELDPSMPLPVSIGMESGQSLRRKGAYVGAGIFLAQRLCDLASAGQVLVGPTLHGLVRSASVPMKDLGVRRLRDGQSIRVFEAREPDTSHAAAGQADRFLATVLFTDIVDSTATAVALGRKRWGEAVERHNEITREELRKHRGSEVDTAGDGFYATFESPSQAIACATVVGRRVRDEVGIGIRAGVHTGECEIVAGKVGGLSVVVGARIRDLAGADDILVSQTVKDLLLGSPVSLRQRAKGVTLKGVPATWDVYEVTRDPR